jgi:hypothetical protein
MICTLDSFVGKMSPPVVVVLVLVPVVVVLVLVPLCIWVIR